MHQTALAYPVDLAMLQNLRGFCSTPLADFLPHETVVAWVRDWFRKKPFKAVEDVEVNHRMFLDRLRECEAYVNTLDTEGVCRGPVKRLRELRAAKGARLRR